MGPEVRESGRVEGDRGQVNSMFTLSGWGFASSVPQIAIAQWKGTALSRAVNLAKEFKASAAAGRNSR